MRDPKPVLEALIAQQEASQWFSKIELRKLQFGQLELLAAHFAQHSAHFQARLTKAGLRPQDLGRPRGLAKLPPIDRRAFQSASGLFSSFVPANHQPLQDHSTSGSTGEPVVVKRTALSRFSWLAATMRDHLWHKTDFLAPLAVVRANIFELSAQDSWGPPVNLLHRSGPSLRVPITHTGEELFEILSDFGVGNLLIYPGTLHALLDYMEASGRSFDALKVVRTQGETLSDELRARTLKVLGCAIRDGYSSQEFGYLALQCPDNDMYHVMAENVLIEVLDHNDKPCLPGQIGRVVVTDLLNYATPLVRYVIGDYAEVGEKCTCGRELPTLRRILGRERNLVLMPDGRRVWPLVGFYRFRDIAPVKQYQLVQHALSKIEVRLVVEASLTPLQEEQLSEQILSALGHPFELSFRYFEGRLPLSASGKFEEFVCQVETAH